MSASAADAAYRLVTSLLPGPIADRVLPGRRREYREVGVTSAPEAGRRLLIGPVNSAGQGFAWAEAASSLGDVSAASFMYRDSGDVFGFTAHHVIPVSALISNGRWRAAQERAILTGFTHVIIESGRSIFERDGDVVQQVRKLERAGIRVALLWHGSDIRLPSAHAAGEPDSPFAHGYPDTAALERIAAANRAIAVETGAFQFVSTPDLLDFAPGARWLPVSVDPDEWESAATTRAFTRDRPIVVHAPSRAGLKGSDRIAEPMRRLDAEGLIEYRELHGVPSAQMRAVYGDADIVLDQFLVGGYGVAACEAMAAGRLVIGHVSDDVRASVRAESGLDLPIQQSRASDIEQVLRRIVEDRAGSADIAASGKTFARVVHGGAFAARALQAFLATSTEGVSTLIE